ncbi:RNA polymerase sigma factor [Cohnella suwonensis]|uniref:RNA polymerase sigma factor n=1 Tax=Cohnella suwonensis TaxID=696072 RepID=A0ABW0LXV7_9BACL
MRDNLLLLLGPGFDGLNRSLQEEIYREFYRFLYRPIYSMINDHSAAEDIIQESFLTAVSKRPSVESDEHMKAWIKVVAKNHTINHLRKRRKFRNDISLEFHWDKGGQAAYATPSFEQEVVAKSLEEQVSRHLLDMKPEQRTLIELKWKQGMSYKEIAAEVQDTESAVKHKLHRARSYLRRMLNGEGGNRDE